MVQDNQKQKGQISGKKESERERGHTHRRAKNNTLITNIHSGIDDRASNNYARMLSRTEVGKNADKT